MEQIFVVSVKRQLLMLSHCIMITVFSLLFFGVLFGPVSEYAIHPIYFAPVAFVLITSILPTLFLHIQYLRYNQNAELVINGFSESITFKKGKKEVTKSFHEIQNTTCFLSFGKKSSGWYSFAEYKYARIIFSDGKEMIITCLLMNDLNITLELLLKTPIKAKYKLIANI